MEDVAARSPMREWVRSVIDLSGKDLGEWRVGVIARTNREAMRAFQGLARYHDVPTRLRLADKDLYDGRVDRREHEDEPSRQERKRLGEASITVYTVHTAKGQDFDEAWLCGDTIASALECCDLTSAEQIEEARVAYVALTRLKGPTYVLPTIPAASDAPSPG